MNFFEQRQLIQLNLNLNPIAACAQILHLHDFDLSVFALLAEEAGADGVSVDIGHPTITVDALQRLSKGRITPLQIRTSLDQASLDFVRALHPDEICLTSKHSENTFGAIDVQSEFLRVQEVLQKLRQDGLRVCLSISVSEAMVRAAHQIGVSGIEFYLTAHDVLAEKETGSSFVESLNNCVNLAQRLGLRVAVAGEIDHAQLVQIAALPGIDRLTVGNLVMERALMLGWEKAVREIKASVHKARLGIL
jgi:pyridoxine 5-phosphate synthase